MKPIFLVFLLARLATAKLGQKQVKTNNWEEEKYHRLSRKLAASSTPSPPTGDENSSRQESLAFPGTRIVGGTQTAQGKYPWFVNWAGSCGASLIHDDIILSAAHCNEITSNSVRVGSWKLNSNSGVQQKTIVSRRKHPNYNPNTFAYDFVVMKLNSAVTGGVKPVSINGDASNPTSGETLRVIGHGTTRSGGSPSNLLLEADVNSIPYNRCNPAYASNGSPLDDAVMFCAGVTGGGKDSCQGDSGEYLKYRRLKHLRLLNIF
jgi:secreted trypsin-like serine protease